jgi:hypothetical protein
MNKSYWLTAMFAFVAAQFAGCVSMRPVESHHTYANSDECVVLLHGLTKTYRSMSQVEQALQEAGYATANIDYPSRAKSIEILASETIPLGVSDCRAQSAQRIHFVTHSMGGILVRYYLEDNDISELGRVVMLSPPNQGIEIVDRFSGLPGFEALVGPAGAELGGGDDGVPLQLGPADFEVGIITGDKGINFIFSGLIPGPDDGLISVERAKLEGMTAFIVVPKSHTTISKSDQAISQIIHFLANGEFEISGEF